MIVGAIKEKQMKENWYSGIMLIRSTVIDRSSCVPKHIEWNTKPKNADEITPIEHIGIEKTELSEYVIWNISSCIILHLRWNWRRELFWRMTWAQWVWLSSGEEYIDMKTVFGYSLLSLKRSTTKKKIVETSNYHESARAQRVMMASENL